MTERPPPIRRGHGPRPDPVEVVEWANKRLGLTVKPISDEMQAALDDMPDDPTDIEAMRAYYARHPVLFEKR